MSESPEGFLKKIAESGLGIRFGRGVVGKTSHAMIVMLVVWGVVIWKLDDNIVTNCFLIGGGLVATLLFVWFTKSTQGFAQRNPAQAMLDGAEFLEYHKHESQVKGQLPQVSGVLIETGATPSRRRGRD